MLGFALLWIAIAAAATLHTIRRDGLPFTPAWWSFVFPVGTLVTGTAVLARHTGSDALKALALALLRRARRRMADRRDPHAQGTIRAMAATPNATPLSGSELVAFAVAVELGSVHGAADALGLTASAVTKRIASLERRVGATLFERGRFGLRATPAAQLLYPDAKQAIAALERAAATMAQHVGTQAQLLTIAASHTTGEFLLPEWLGAFRITAPQTRAQVDITNSTAVVAAVRDGAVDVGFVEGRDALDGLEALTVHRDEIVVVVAAQPPLGQAPRGRRPRAARRVLHHPRGRAPGPARSRWRRSPRRASS